jgi:hypothetical protein
MQEAQDVFDVEFDAPPPPVLDFADGAGLARVRRVDLDGPPTPAPPSERRAQAFTLWARSAHFDAHFEELARCVRTLLTDNPHTTLQVVLEPPHDADAGQVQRQLSPRRLASLVSVCQENPTYLDKFYALQPGRTGGAKRLVLL